jgi:hypothetical protein
VRAAKRADPKATDGRTVIRVGREGRQIDLSRADCWDLYVLLGDAAPFVRNQLTVIRNGGDGSVLLATTDERQQVLAALLVETLSPGLESLKLALAGSPDA